MCGEIAIPQCFSCFFASPYPMNYKTEINKRRTCTHLWINFKNKKILELATQISMFQAVARSFNTNMVSGGRLDCGHPTMATGVTDINTQPVCFWIIPPDMTHSSSLDHDKTMTSPGSTGRIDEHGLGGSTVLRHQHSHRLQLRC